MVGCAPACLELDLGPATSVGHVALEEEIAYGQHVLAYELEVLADGKWTTVATGESIGRKRIERFKTPVRAERIRLRICKAGAVPVIRTFAVYDVPSGKMQDAE